MANKFFTWTKGDRRNAPETLHSGGVVPIPAECITIHGMDYARSSRVRPMTKACWVLSLTTGPGCKQKEATVTIIRPRPGTEL